MFAKSRSLTATLAWRLIGLQVFILFCAIATLTYRLHASWSSYISQSVTSTIANAIHVSNEGGIELREDDDLRSLVRESPGLWFAVEDEKGRRLERGEIPAVYRPLVRELAQLQNSEIHANRSPYTLNLRVDLVNTGVGQIRVICGGAAHTNPGAMFMFLISYLGWRTAIPLVLVTLVVMPWLIRRSMSGVEELARQAQSIDIDERGVRLDDEAVPRELQPLVQAFNEALRRLNEGVDARDRFLASAAHELRLPIAILETRLETLEPGGARTRLLADLARLSNLTEQLLDLQRLDKKHGKFEPVDLVAVAQEVMADVAPLAVDAGYDLALDVPDKRVMVSGDRLSLSRVMINLLQNAITHGGASGLITIDVKRDGSFGVSDHGPGIPAQERSRIFEPFYRLRPGNPGSGLGLHLVREIVVLHGGRIEVTETASGGACFRVRLRTMAEHIAASMNTGVQP